MPSKSKSAREAQKVQCETAISARRDELKEKGLDQAAIKKDPRLKQLLAKFRQIQKTLLAIQAKADLNEKLAQRKKEKAENPKDKADKKGKSKKKGDKKAEESGKKKKAKKEKKSK
jgi:hypothetical protein